MGSKEAPAERARLLNAALRVLPRMVAHAQCHWMIVNQNRQKIGVMFGSNKTQPGGNAPKYHSTIRLELAYAGKVGKPDCPTGIEVVMNASKNSMAPPYRKVTSYLDFQSGWTDQGVLDLAKKLKAVPPKTDSVQEAREALERLSWDPGNLMKPSDPVCEEVMNEDE